MLFTNPTRQYYLDSKLEDRKFIEEISGRICSPPRGIDSYNQCRLEIVNNPASIERLLASNYQRSNFYIFSIHRLEIAKINPNDRSINLIESSEANTVGVLGVFIGSLQSLVIGAASISVLALLFSGIAVGIRKGLRLPEKHDIE
jgi:hypothetical protein